MEKFEIAARVKGREDGAEFHMEVIVDSESDAKKIAIQKADSLAATGHPVCAALIKQGGRWVGICPTKA
ncbi:hypothetical protein [Burkholderia glumae]|uniref:hypothetical protein n=1 Tax=Burkholderia glumae TaxID=337 RepID=UPI0020CFE5FA|nr:hypothetical protein [Burkholderia glumae]MCQ0032543.1 hypothetical protein [Burkholderia glumae]MCQ0035819.1 hypothetical protein [Burkholderia glumae]